MLMIDALWYFSIQSMWLKSLVHVSISFSDKVYEGDFTLGDHDSELIIIYLYVCNYFNF